MASGSSKTVGSGRHGAVQSHVSDREEPRNSSTP